MFVHTQIIYLSAACSKIPPPVFFYLNASQQHGLKKLKSLYDFLAGDLTLIADLPEFCPLQSLPDSYHYIGPLIWEGLNEGVNDTVLEYLQHRSRSTGLIYATTGNTGQEQFIQLIVDAFQHDSFYQVVLTTGTFINPKIATDVSNIYVERFIPGSQVMAQAQAVIHCGGNGTTYQAMSQGRPTVVIPFNNDQKINAWLIRKNGVGVFLSPSNLTGGKVKEAVERLTNDIQTQKQLQYFKQLLAKVDSPKTAADKIEAFLAMR